MSGQPIAKGHLEWMSDFFQTIQLQYLFVNPYTNS